MKIIKPEFYHAVIKITQVPNVKNKSKENVSWLCDPFIDGYVYGTKFTIDNEYFSWKFFIKEGSKGEALKSGYKFLDYLKEIYPGLSGVVKVKPIYSKKLNEKKILFEIVVPTPPFNKKINLFKKILNLFTFNSRHLIKIYVLWQKDDSILGGGIEQTELEKEYKLDENYKIKIFVSIMPSFDENLDNEEQIQELKGHIEYLATDICNTDGVKAFIKQASNETWERILNGTPFWKNILGKVTGRYYRRIQDQISEDKIPGFVNPKVMDFEIPENILIDKAIHVRNENISFTQRPNKNDISLGYYISRGVITKRIATLPVNDLARHAHIGGKTGVGKTSFINSLQREISRKNPKLGVLIIGLKKSKEDIPYNLDITLRYGDPDFRVPYYFKGENFEVTFEQTAALIVSSMGLKQPVDHAMYNVMLAYFKEKKNVPPSLESLFGKLLIWFKKHPYHKKYQTNILNAINNRILKWVKSPILDKITRLPSIKPYWFIEWMNGKNVFIDISESICNRFMKKLLINLIFQMIRIFFPEIKTNELRNLVILDEVGDILKRPSTNIARDDDFVSQYFLEEVFCNFLEAFRSRGIGLITTAQLPSHLFESIYTLPNIHILFTLGHSCAKLFTNNREEQDTLMLLGKRKAIVKDGVNSRNFAIYTIDFDYVKDTSQSLKSPDKLCPLCNNYIEPYENFCSACGIPLNSDSKLSNDNLNEESTKLKEKN